MCGTKVQTLTVNLFTIKSLVYLIGPQVPIGLVP